MDTNKPILDFLAETENLSLAFEISEYLDELKANLHISFWGAFNKKMHTRFSEFENLNWRFIEIPRKSFRSQWKYSFIAPLHKPQAQPFVQLFFAQTNRDGKYTLLRGISWSSWNKVPEGWTHPALETLHSRAISLGMTGKGNQWIRFRDYPYQLEGLAFMQEMTKDMEAAVDKVFDDLWNSFIELRPLMEEINQAISENP